MKVWTFAVYCLARLEVCRERLRGFHRPGDVCEDLLPPQLIPSVGKHNLKDRVLAEIDQDGFIFAVEEGDARFFNKRETMCSRKEHRVQIVLTNGRVHLRKSTVRKETHSLGRIRDSLQWEFYLEAAALIRLRGRAGVPQIQHIDPAKGTIEMDYIWGLDLRQCFSQQRCEIDYEQVSHSFLTLLADGTGEVAKLLNHVVGCGVIPRDVHAANFIRGWRSGKLYIVDFNLVWLRPVFGWRYYASRLASMLATRPS